MTKSTRNILMIGAVIAVGYYAYTKGFFGSKEDEQLNLCGCGGA
jgi:hypothetical protein